MKPWARTGRVLAAAGVGLAVALGAWWLGSGQEVAPGGHAPEPVRAVAAPPPEAPPPAAAAPPAGAPKGQCPREAAAETPGPQPEAAPKGGRAAVRNACLGLTGCALQACMGAPQQVPPELPAPPPQACPAGAVETMTATLGFSLGETTDRGLEPTCAGRSVRVHEDTPVYVFGDWEAGADCVGRGGKVALPNQTRLSGRLYVKEGRVYGRFTEARTPLGVTYPVCLELLDTSDKVGLELRARQRAGEDDGLPRRAGAGGGPLQVGARRARGGHDRAGGVVEPHPSGPVHDLGGPCPMSVLSSAALLRLVLLAAPLDASAPSPA